MRADATTYDGGFLVPKEMSDALLELSPEVACRSSDVERDEALDARLAEFIRSRMADPSVKWHHGTDLHPAT